MICRLALTLVTCLPLAGSATWATAAAEQPATRPARPPPARPFTNKEVVKLDERTITVVPTGRAAQRDRAPVTYAIDRNTRVFTSWQDGERKTPSGQVIRSYRVEPSELAALKVGQLVMVEPEGDRAARITIVPPPAPPPEKKPPAEDEKKP